MKNNLLVLVGAMVGGFVGYHAFFWLVSQGMYGIILPGSLLGIGAGLFRPKSLAIPIACGMAALTLGIYAEWRFAPFIADESFGYMVAHLHQKAPIKLFELLAGGALGFWVPFRRWHESRGTPEAPVQTAV